MLPPLIVLSGPAGAGKNTVVEGALEVCRFPLRRAVTATTRDPRPGEEAGRDYHFWPRKRFEEAIAGGELLEYAVVHGMDYYGTPRTEVDGARLAGFGVLLVIDVQGAAAVRRLYPGDHRSVFLDVPNLGELERRLRGRNTETEERIARRLATAAQEMARAGEFDLRVVNAHLPDAVQELARIIDDEFATRGFTPCSTN
ncbi:MAG: guanylate kinase [Fimbriiglobus sp.]|nr:guanylate kinase [Fimbriiglobus sp.]